MYNASIMVSIQHKTKRQDKASPKEVIPRLEWEERMGVSMGALTGLDWRTDPSRNECASVISEIRLCNSK